MNSRQRVLAALRLEQPDRVPFIEGDISPRIEAALLGKDTYQPEEVNEVMGLDNRLALFLPPIIAQYHEEDGINYVAAPLLRTRADLDRLVLPDPNDPALYPRRKRWCAATRAAMPSPPRCAWASRPRSSAWGWITSAYALADDPGLVDTDLARYADWSIAILRRLRDVGVDFVWTMDDMAYRAGPMFSPRTFRSLIHAAHAPCGGRHPRRRAALDLSTRTATSCRSWTTCLRWDSTGCTRWSRGRWTSRR